MVKACLKPRQKELSNRQLVSRSVGYTAIILLLFNLASCGNSHETADAFAVLDQAVGEVNLALTGNVIHDERYGHLSISSDPPSRRLSLISTDSSTFEANINDRLQVSGFSKQGGTWSRGQEKSRVTVFVTILRQGEPFPEDTSPSTVPPGAVGAVIRFVARF